MRVVLSECLPDYVSYTFPYHVWGFLEEGDTPGTALALGFLPLTFDLSRFYLSRSIRVQLSDFKPNKRIRYAKRQCAHISSQFLERADFEFTAAWRDLATAYFATRAEAVEYRQRRFLEMLDSPFTTHVMLWTDDTTGAPVGLAPLYLEEQVGEYGISIYAPEYTAVNIGNHMLAEILQKLQELGCTHGYVGTCYSEEALYKTRVPGMQFFNGFRWSDDRAELHHFLDRQQPVAQEHILSTEAYAKAFGGVGESPVLWRLQAPG